MSGKAGFNIPKEDNKNMLTNLKDNDLFTITELEVWEVKEIEN
jgi:hypothetical protein